MALCAVLSCLNDHNLLEDFLALVSLLNDLYSVIQDLSYPVEERDAWPSYSRFRFFQSFDLVLINEELVHEHVTLDLVLDLKMGIKHHLDNLSHVVSDIVDPQSNHGLLCHHVLDVKDTALFLQPSS